MSYPQSPSDALVARIQNGDRSAAAEFVRANESLLRRRYRSKVGSALRRITDSEDLVSTLSRRLDAYVLSGKLRVVTPEQLWALMHTIMQRSLADKGRLLQRLRRAEAEDRELARAVGEWVEHDRDVAPEPERSVEGMLELLDDPIDREITALWLHDVQLKMIAEQLGMSEEGVRKRWQRIRTSLRLRLAAA